MESRLGSAELRRTFRLIVLQAGVLAGKLQYGTAFGGSKVHSVPAPYMD